MARIGLRSLGVDLDPISNLTIKEVFGEGIVPVTECNRRWWKTIKDRNLKRKLEIVSKAV